MADYSYVLYDTALFGVTASTTHTLFQVVEDGDSVHVKDFTNMKGSGSLPAGETFRVRKLGVSPETDLAEADEVAWLQNSFLQLKIADFIAFQAPLIWCADRTGYNGHFTQAAAANRSFIGRDGDGYRFDPMPVIKGNVRFSVIIFQGTALTAASQRIKVALEGIYTFQ